MSTLHDSLAHVHFGPDDLVDLIGGGNVGMYDVPFVAEREDDYDDLIAGDYLFPFEVVDESDAEWIAGETADAPEPAADSDLAWLIEEAEQLCDTDDVVGSHAVCGGAALDLVHSFRFWGLDSAVEFIGHPKTRVTAGELARLKVPTFGRSPLAVAMAPHAAFYANLGTAAGELLALWILRIAAEAEHLEADDCGDYEFLEAAHRAAESRLVMEARGL